LKRLIAILTAAVMTSLIALGMLVVGVSAMMNPNSVPVSDSPDAPAAVAQTTTTSDPQAAAQINQLKSLVTQYQNREKQYQTQIDQLNQQVQQLQNVLQQLQSMGVIRINGDGTIQLRRGRGN
jgi:peptidoglycan hydrolase CwlO-like protein